MERWQILKLILKFISSRHSHKVVLKVFRRFVSHVWGAFYFLKFPKFGDEPGFLNLRHNLIKFGQMITA